MQGPGPAVSGLHQVRDQLRQKDRGHERREVPPPPAEREVPGRQDANGQRDLRRADEVEHLADPGEPAGAVPFHEAEERVVHRCRLCSVEGNAASTAIAIARPAMQATRTKSRAVLSSSGCSCSLRGTAGCSFRRPGRAIVGRIVQAWSRGPRRRRVNGDGEVGSGPVGGTGRRSAAVPRRVHLRRRAGRSDRLARHGGRRIVRLPGIRGPRPGLRAGARGERASPSGSNRASARASSWNPRCCGGCCSSSPSTRGPRWTSWRGCRARPATRTPPTRRSSARSTEPRSRRSPARRGRTPTRSPSPGRPPSGMGSGASPTWPRWRPS